MHASDVWIDKLAMFISQRCALCCWSAVFQRFRHRRRLPPVHKLPSGGDHWHEQRRDLAAIFYTGPITLIILFLVLHFNFLFVPCGRLSWLPISFLLHVKYTLSYRIVSYFGGLNKHFKPNMRKVQMAISSDLSIRLTRNLTSSCGQQQRLRGWSRMMVKQF